MFKMDELQRRMKFRERYEIFRGNVTDAVVRRMLEIYPKAGDIGLLRQIDLTQNPFRTIINKISRVYSFGVKRKYSKDLGKEVAKITNFGKVLKETNRFVNAFNDILIQVAYTKKPKLIIRFPHSFEVETDKDGELKSVSYLVDINRETFNELWAYWSEDEHYYIIKDPNGNAVDEQTVEGNEQRKNPFGILPFVVVQNGFRDTEFFDPYSGDDLVNLTADVCVYNTFKNYLIKWQSFKQLIVTGTNVGTLDGQLLDPATALTAEGTDIKIDLLDLQADLKQLRETIQSSVIDVALNYNVSPSQYRLTGDVASGIALKIENSALDEFTKEQQTEFRQIETEVWEKLKIVTEYYTGKNIGDMEVDITEPTYPTEESEKMVVIKEKIDLGLESITEIIAKERDITEEEAEKILKRNIELRNKLYNRVDITEPNIDINLE